VTEKFVSLFSFELDNLALLAKKKGKAIHVTGCGGP
jgi:hypothetical protein